MPERPACPWCRHPVGRYPNGRIYRHGDCRGSGRLAREYVRPMTTVHLPRFPRK